MRSTKTRPARRHHRDAKKPAKRGVGGERREVGGAGSQSNLGTRLGLGFNGLTVAGTPKVSTVPPALSASIKVSSVKSTELFRPSTQNTFNSAQADSTSLRLGKAVRSTAIFWVPRYFNA
jgi:hypothetical protein